MINFSEVKKSVVELKSQLTGGQIDEKTFEDRLLDLIDVASDGYYWMYGHESERWFRHDGEKWVPDDPSRLFDSQATVESSELNDPSPGVATEPGLTPDEYSINWGWFIAGIIIIAVIGGLVYYSALI